VLPCFASTGNGTGIVWDQQGHVSGASHPFGLQSMCVQRSPRCSIFNNTHSSQAGCEPQPQPVLLADVLCQACHPDCSLSMSLYCTSLLAACSLSCDMCGPINRLSPTTTCCKVRLPSLVPLLMPP
jgi:hypothetical protein